MSENKITDTLSEMKPEDDEDDGFFAGDELFSMLPEGTRIIIRGNKVTFENLTPELLDVAKALNPDDENLKKR